VIFQYPITAVCTANEVHIWQRTDRPAMTGHAADICKYKPVKMKARGGNGATQNCI